MAIIRQFGQIDNTVSFIATLAFFCCVSCVTVMLKFGGFKASLNFNNGIRSKNRELDDHIGSTISVVGAYRTNRDEFMGYNNTEVERKTQSIVPKARPLPTLNIPKPQSTPLRQVKSTSDLIKNKNLPQNLQQDNPGISKDPRGSEQSEPRIKDPKHKGRNKERKLDAQKRVDKQRLEEQNKLEKKRLQEQKKLDKQRLEQQKKQEKQALQEQAKQDKLRKEREKKEAQQAKKDLKKKKVAPQHSANPLTKVSASASNNPLGQTNADSSDNRLGQTNVSASNNPLGQSQIQAQYSTNTLESSISKSSGPPPYSEIPKAEGNKDSTGNVMYSKPVETGSSGNVTYSKPVDTGSWDLISQHRQQMSRTINTAPKSLPKQTMMDLKYKIEEGNERDNSEA